MSLLLHLCNFSLSTFDCCTLQKELQFFRLIIRIKRIYSKTMQFCHKTNHQKENKKIIAKYSGCTHMPLKVKSIFTFLETFFCLKKHKSNCCRCVFAVMHYHTMFLHKQCYMHSHYSYKHHSKNYCMNNMQT